MPPYDTLHVWVGTREATQTYSDVAHKKDIEIFKGQIQTGRRYEYVSRRYGVLWEGPGKL